MSGGAPDTITVVISTFERPAACERALLSVLAQVHKPLEILICDDGSRDETPVRFRDWERRRPEVRYLRLDTNNGTPAATRNLGVSEARGSWVAFLDDDDEWLPEKLARQLAAIADETVELIATNALRSGGHLYFANAPAALWPTRADVLAANPIITSSVLVRRSLAGFPTATWMRGIEDYAAWLALADRGTRMLVLGDPLVRYEDAATDRLSAARATRELAVTRLLWRRALERPVQLAKLRAAMRRTLQTACVVVIDARAVLRARGRAALPRSGAPRRG